MSSKRRVSSGVQLWTPDQISTLAWYKASDASTITVGTGGISEWRDKSGNLNNLTQSDANKRPGYINNEVVFDGSNIDGLRFDQPINTANFNAFYVLKTSDTLVILLTRSTTIYDIVGQIGSTSQPVGSHYGTPTFRKNASDVLISTRNDVYTEMCTGAYEIIHHKDADTTDTNWSTMSLCDYSAGGFNFDGSIAEIIYSSNLLSADMEKIEGYLAHEHSSFGLLEKLPISHPYKTNPPTI